ncbi:TerB family tellurite resistance protein [Chryseolinea sp. H1M3-3]|uniref:TerB family tellurite resistance protein n=1 Tax=Chryseolinea sp. H1M3-3 TaxID=3034144 RepID=UPI0023EAA6B0|nr:TerB family tellurite resistance protein [Chryseolinea sp. H1M3-3]
MSALNQLKLLISLAQIDGKVAERERNFITAIGKANEVRPDEIEPLFDQRHELIIPGDLTDDQKFDYLFSLVQLMKIDERMYKEEMLFCSKIAANLGYSNDVMFELLLHVKAGVMEKDEVVNLKEITQKHLKS